MKNTISIKDKAKKFELMLGTLDSLKSINYKLQLSKHVVSNGPAGDSFEFLISSDTGISIEFTFYPAYQNKSDYVVIYVINDNKDKDFSLDSWMQKYHTVSKKNPFSLSNYNGNYDQQLMGFFNFLNKLFKEEKLNNILEGKSWMDVEFNWGDLK